MAPRYFADETDLALGKALAPAHDDVVYPGHPSLPEIPRRAIDDDWLAILERHWRHIEAIVEREPDGPWMYAVTGSGLRPIELTAGG